MGLQCDFNPVSMPAPPAEPNLLVNKPYIMLNPVQNRFNFELNGWSPGRALVYCSNHRLTPPTKTSYSLLDPFLAAPGAASPSVCLFRRRRRRFPRSEKTPTDSSTDPPLHHRFPRLIHAQ